MSDALPMPDVMYLVCLDGNTDDLHIVPISAFRTFEEAADYAKMLVMRTGRTYYEIHKIGWGALPMSDPHRMYDVTVCAWPEGDICCRTKPASVEPVIWGRSEVINEGSDFYGLDRPDLKLCDSYDGKVVWRYGKNEMTYHILAKSRQEAKQRALALFEEGHPEAAS